MYDFHVLEKFMSEDVFPVIPHIKNKDEDFMDIACHHAQQAIEKLLKFIIEISGEEYPKTHNITRLCAVIEKLPNIVLPDKLLMMSETLTIWEATSRYSPHSTPLRRPIQGNYYRYTG